MALEKIIFHAMVLWSSLKRLPMKMQSDSLAPFVEGVPMLGFKYFCCIKVMLLSGPLWKKWRSKILQNWVDSCRFTLQRSHLFLSVLPQITFPLQDDHYILQAAC